MVQLVRLREAEGDYTPIPAADVAAAQMPPPREPDAYLKSRLDQFHAELQVRSNSFRSSVTNLMPLLCANRTAI